MRLLPVTGVLLIFTSSGFGQNEQDKPRTPEQIILMADHEVKNGGTLKLRGHVQVITGPTTIYADEADYNPITGELDARGHVHMDFKKAKARVTIQNSTPEDMPVN